MKKLLFTIATVALALTACAQGPRGGRGGGMMMDKSADSTLTRMIATEVPKFKQLTFNDPQTGASLPYNLFVPSDYDGSQQLPLVLYMSDASTAGSDSQRPLTQGWGGLIWVTEAEQAKHPAIVLVPGYTAQSVDDDWNTTAEVEMTIRLLEQVCNEYNVDRTRLYTTGQSMGGMMSFYFNITHPHLFAASLFVGSQWDTSKMSPFIGNKFFYIVGGGDIKASKGMAELKQVLAQQGVTPAMGGWSAKLPTAVQNDSVRAMLAQGNNINFISFEAGSVLPESGKGMEHMCSFDFAYRLDAVRDWLFEQRLDGPAPATSPLVIARDGDWHGDNITPLMAVKKAIDKGAYAVMFNVEKDSDGNVVVKSDHNSTATLLSDVMSLAQGRIEVIARGDVTVDGAMTVPVVNLDSKSWKKDLNKVLDSEFVELRYSKQDKQLTDAMKLIDGRCKVLVNTTAAGLAGNHVDMTRGGNVQQSWGELKDMDVDGIITDQIKPMLKWLNNK